MSLQNILQDTLVDTLGNELLRISRFTPDSFDRFSSLIDPSEIDAVLSATGTISIRKRKLPAERMVWLVIGLALFRNEPIWQIVRQLDLVMRKRDILNGDASDRGESRETSKETSVAPSAVIQARQRLGAAPMKELFVRLSEDWDNTGSGNTKRFFGLRSYAVDGVVWSLQENSENAAAFARNGSGPSSPGAWPQLRAVCLLETESRIVRSVSFGDYAQGELSYAKDLVERVPDESLTIFDRAYYSCAFLSAWQSFGKGHHWLLRAKDKIRHEIIETFGVGDFHVRLIVSPQARKKDPSLPEHWEARLIERTINGKPYRFLTSLMDPRIYDATAIAEHYIERWEIELAYREVKQGLLDGELVLRSKTPELVEQEVWGMLLAYNLVRSEIRAMAEDLKVPPRRLSFQGILVAIASAFIHWPIETPGTFPARLAWLRSQASVYLLPERRPRKYPRVVKPRGSKYPPKKCQS